MEKCLQGCFGQGTWAEMPTSTRGKGKWKSYSLVFFERVVWAVEVVEGLEQNFDCVQLAEHYSCAIENL